MSKKRKKLKTPEILRIVSNSITIMTNELSKYSLKKADYVIKPNLIGFSQFGFQRAPELIRRGAIATDKCADKIKRLIQK